MKLNDIFTNLDENINLKDLGGKSYAFVKNKLLGKSTKDLQSGLKDLSLKEKKRKKEIPLVSKLKYSSIIDLKKGCDDVILQKRKKEKLLVKKLIQDNTRDLKEGNNDINIKGKAPNISLKLKEKLSKINTENLKTNLKNINLENKKQVFKLVNKLSNRNTKDIGSNFEDIVFESVKLKLSKNETINFDALSRIDKLNNLKNPIKLNNIPISKKIKKILNNIFLYIKNLFHKKLKKSRNFFRKPYKIIKKFHKIKKFYKKKLFPFYLFLFLVIIGTLGFWSKSFVESRVKLGYQRLIEIKEKPDDIEFVKKQVNDAKFDFTISDIVFFPFSFLDTLQINNAYNVIKGGKYITKALDDGLSIYDKVLVFIDKNKIEEIRLTGLLLNLKEEFSIINNDLKIATAHFKEIHSLGDISLENSLNKQIGRLDLLLKYSNLVNNNFDSLLNLLGNNETKTYLIAFQNSDEIRPMGGFMGSMGVIKIFKGKIDSFEKRDIYAYEWDLKNTYYELTPAPRGINRLATNFWLRDANYYIKTKKSSDTIKSFMDKINYDIDGIIYINQNILLDFLDKTGEVKFEDLGENISSENFSEIMSTLVESKIYKVGKTGTPKKILFDFIEVFIKKLKTDGDYLTYLKIIQDSVEKRDIIFYSFDEVENNFLKELGLVSDIDFSKTVDFSYPVFTSISGNKSDRYIKRDFKKVVTIKDNCDIETNLEIISKHTFAKKDEDRVKALLKKYDLDDTEKLLGIQGQGDNNQFIRVLLPSDAVIKGKSGLAVYDYKDFKVAEFFVKTKKGEISKFNLDYSLENKNCNKYDFMFYKQAGIRDYNLEIVGDSYFIDEVGLYKDFYYK